jgi:Fic family protein
MRTAIERAPDYRELLKSADLTKLLEVSTNPDFVKLINKANQEYLYWDKFRYIYNFGLLSKELAWSFIKFVRSSRLKRITLKDPGGSNFGYWVPDSIVKDLHYLDQHASGEILVEDADVPKAEKDRYLISSLMEEAIASSQLEGAATTRKVAKEMLRFRRRPKNRSEQMIFNNYLTIREIKNNLDKPMTLELLKAIHASMTKDTLDDSTAYGRFRQEDEPVVVATPEGDILHDPPPARDLGKRLELMCKYANEDKEAEFTHPVVRAIILHFWLAYEHPFVDGNGRTARALFYWYMLKKGYWLTEYISISRVIKRASAQYIRSFLYTEKDELDVTYFLHFNLKVIHIAIDEFRKYITRQTKQVQESRKALVAYPGLNHRQSQLLRHALTHSDALYTIESHLNSHGVTHQTARTDLFDLVKDGLLNFAKRGRQYYFVPVPNLDRKLNKRSGRAKTRSPVS